MMKFKIEIITPTIIRSHNIAYPIQLFEDENGKILLLDIFKFFESSGSANQNFVEDFKKLINNFIEYKKSNSSRDQKAFLNKEAIMNEIVRRSSDFYHKYIRNNQSSREAIILENITSFLDAGESHLRIFEIFYPINSGEGNRSIYIPGSSIKGSLLSGVYHRLIEDFQCKTIINDGKNSDKNLKDIMKELGSLIKVDDFLPQEEDLELGLIKIQREYISMSKSGKKGIPQYIIAIMNGTFKGDISLNHSSLNLFLNNEYKKKWYKVPDRIKILNCAFKVNLTNNSKPAEVEDVIIKNLPLIYQEQLISVRKIIERNHINMVLENDSNFNLGAYRGALLMGIEKYTKTPPHTAYRWNNKILGQVKLEEIKP